MAKYGEGDQRWIVEERVDGTNVHNWHWAETDCLEWSRNLFSNLLTDVVVMEGEGGLYIKLKKVDKVEGEAYVNVRKGKIIPGYELKVVILWEGEAKDEEGRSVIRVDGSAEIPYISDENADEDPEIRVSVKDEGPIGKRLKEAMMVKGKRIIEEKVRVFVESMAKGGPNKDELENKKVGGKGFSGPVKKDVLGSGVGGAGSGTEKKEKVKKERKKGLKTINLTERFSCRAVDLYEILMDENRWKGFSQSNAKISREVGGEISIFDGSVTGNNVELQVGKLIVQKWRFGSWPDGVVSTVKLAFEEPEPGLTIITLSHSDIPEEDRYGNATVVENTERGWRDLIFHRIRAVFGFGI